MVKMPGREWGKLFSLKKNILGIPNGPQYTTTRKHINRPTEQQQQRPGEPIRVQICYPEERSAAASNQFRAEAV